MKVNICLLWLLCLCTSAIAQEKKYTVKGNITGANVPMKAFLYFRDGDRKVTDSTMTQNNKFTFSGKLEHATEATVYVHWIYPPNVKPQGPTSEGIQLMLELGTVSIVGERLRNAKITGGEAQQDYMAYKKRIDVVGDSVYRIWKAQQDVLPEDSAAALKRLIYARGKMIQNATKDFVKKHPKSAVSFNILQTNTLVISDIPYVESMLGALRPEFGKSDRFKAVEQKVNLTKRLDIGKQAINFSQMDDKGKMVSLSDVKGKYILIDFWASWCGPCRTEYPFLKKAYSEFKDKNFEIIGVSLDDKKTAWLDAIKSNGFEWIELCDLQGRDNAVAKAYGVAAIPQSFLIDPQGMIIAKNLRGDDLIEKLKEVIH